SPQLQRSTSLTPPSRLRSLLGSSLPFSPTAPVDKTASSVCPLARDIGRLGPAPAAADHRLGLPRDDDEAAALILAWDDYDTALFLARDYSLAGLRPADHRLALARDGNDAALLTGDDYDAALFLAGDDGLGGVRPVTADHCLSLGGLDPDPRLGLAWENNKAAALILTGDDYDTALFLAGNNGHGRGRGVVVIVDRGGGRGVVVVIVIDHGGGMRSRDGREDGEDCQACLHCYWVVCFLGCWFFTSLKR
ncbi:hypothetical protein F5883DRAFT_678765, partial [Diaporthe sp. PMI_573]